MRETVGQQLVQQEAAGGGGVQADPDVLQLGLEGDAPGIDRVGAGQLGGEARAAYCPRLIRATSSACWSRSWTSAMAWRRPAHLEEAPEPRVVDGALLQAQQARDDLQVVLDSVGHLPHQDVFCRKAACSCSSASLRAVMSMWARTMPRCGAGSRVAWSRNQHGLPGSWQGYSIVKDACRPCKSGLETGEGTLCLGTLGGGPPAHLEIVEADAHPDGGWRLARPAEALPRGVHRDNGALGIEDGNLGREGIKPRLHPYRRCVERVR